MVIFAAHVPKRLRVEVEFDIEVATAPRFVTENVSLAIVTILCS